MVVVVDFDGTLALGDTSNISLMIPNVKLVSLVNSMYSDGNFIKIVTARGSKSCSNIDQRIEKYQRQIEEWLKKNNVNYHSLSFNKEYGDAYIDDRCYNVKSDITYSKLDSTFTNNKVRKINGSVIKKSENIINEVKWYRKAFSIGMDIPDILSYDIDTLELCFIEGKECVDIDLIKKVLSKMSKEKPTNRANFNSYIDRIGNHIANNPSIKKGEKLIESLKSINPPNTFNHGDFSIHNMIERDGKLFLIDPIYSDEIYQSYVIDAAKHLFSVLYYSLNPDFYQLCYDNYIYKLDIDYRTLDILIASESVRVPNRKKQLIDISNNLIEIL
jgi:tRNA A-37 threonylcarbamoyl transferase component Bud32